MTAPKTEQTPRHAWRRILVVFAILAVMGGIFAVRSFRPVHDAAQPREVGRTHLLSQGGLYFQSGQTNPFTGFMVERYASGSLRSRSAITNGLLSGISEGWHTNGQLQVREHFRGGVSHGLRTKWHDGGQLLSEVPIVEGKLHGTFRRWHENGRLAEEIQMAEGEPHGLSRSFHASGSPKAEVTLERGKPVAKQFWPDGGTPLAASASPAQ